MQQNNFYNFHSYKVFENYEAEMKNKFGKDELKQVKI